MVFNFTENQIDTILFALRKLKKSHQHRAYRDGLDTALNMKADNELIDNILEQKKGQVGDLI